MATTNKTTPLPTEAPKETYIVSKPQEDGVVSVLATSAQDAAEQIKPKEQA